MPGDARAHSARESPIESRARDSDGDTCNRRLGDLRCLFFLHDLTRRMSSGHTGAAASGKEVVNVGELGNYLPAEAQSSRYYVYNRHNLEHTSAVCTARSSPIVRRNLGVSTAFFLAFPPAFPSTKFAHVRGSSPWSRGLSSTDRRAAGRAAIEAASVVAGLSLFFSCAINSR